MVIPSHDEIMWRACSLASERLRATGAVPIADPTGCFPLLSRGNWLNDTNQVTVFSDCFTKKSAGCSARVQVLLGELWKLDLAKVVGQMALADPVLAASADSRAQQMQGVLDFGKYIPYDHLDVLADVPADEYDGKGGGHIAKTVRESLDFLGLRLQSCSIGQAPATRLDPGSLTALGRALHSVGDFFAHSNFVELLLWHLAERRLLDDDVVRSFNRPAEPFGTDGDRPFVCALPQKPDDVPRENGILWYGPSAAETPLVSTVFDGKDTAASLLKIYVAQLRREGPAPTDDELSIALAVFDVPGRPIIEAAWSILKAARDVLDAIGRMARSWLADRIDAAAKTGGAERPLLENAAALIRKYDSAEAAEWARAGRFEYVAHALARDLSTALDGQSATKRLLPHHTLLCKDNLPPTAEDRLRYSLACLLATEVCAEIIALHFAPGVPPPDRLARITAGWLVHPTDALDPARHTLNEAGAVAAVKACYGMPWRRRSEAKAGPPLFQ